MDSSRPFLLVRAIPLPGQEEPFAEWWKGVHLRDARRIPGFTTIEHSRTPGGAFLGVYTFESAQAVQQTLSSPEAAYARGTWEQWAGQLEELVVEMFAPLSPMPMFQSHN
jgi:hypothetical protein